MGGYYLNKSSRNKLGGCRLDSSGSGQGPVAGCFEHVSEPSVFTKGERFIY
jgi:hypothetical protein